MIQLLWKTLWQFLKKFNIELPYDSAILLLSIYPREIKTCLHKNLCINVRFSISIIDEKWKQPKCPSTGRWMNQMWYECTKEQFSAIKREVQMHAVTWMNLANMLNEISQIRKTIYVWFHLYEVFKTGKSTETEEWFPGLGMEEEWVTANGHRVSLGCEKMFYNREFCEYTKNYWITEGKMYSLCEWHHNWKCENKRTVCMSYSKIYSLLIGLWGFPLNLSHQTTGASKW